MKSLNNISQMKHINRIRKCAGKYFKNQQDNSNRSCGNQSCLKVHNLYHLNSDLGEENFNANKKTNSDYKHKFHEPVKSGSLKSLRLQQDYWSSIQNYTKNQQSINHQFLYDISQVNHISRIRSMSNIPVSFIFCRPTESEMKYTEFNSINSKSEKYSEIPQNENSLEKLNTCKGKNNSEKTSKFKEIDDSKTENDLVHQDHFSANCNQNKVSNRQHSQRHERNYQMKSMESKSEIIDIKQEKKNKGTSIKQKPDGFRVSNNLNSYRENIASKLRKGTKVRQNIPSYDKAEYIVKYSKIIRNKNSEEYEKKLMFPSESLRTSKSVDNEFSQENKMNLKKEDDFLYLSGGDDCELKILASSTSVPELAEPSIKKRKTWISVGKSSENFTLTQDSNILKKNPLDPVSKIGENSTSIRFLFSTLKEKHLSDIPKISENSTSIKDSSTSEEKGLGALSKIEENLTSSKGSSTLEERTSDSICKFDDEKMTDDGSKYVKDEFKISFGENFAFDSPPKEDYSDQRPIFEFPKVRIIELCKAINPDDFETKLNLI